MTPALASRWRVFFVCSPGLEPLLARELTRLLGRPVEVPAGSAPGGIEERLDPDEVVHAALHTRIAEGVRVRVFERRVTRFDELEALLAKVSWHAWIPRDARLRLHVVCRKSKLIHSGAVAERVERALHHARGARAVDAESPVTLGDLHARLDRDVLTLSVDALFDRAHRRGQRIRTGRAPMRETLAAAALEALPPDVPGIWDPCCGSGTLLLESALRARGSAGRSVADGAWTQWPAWPPPNPERLRALARLARVEPTAPVPALFASDASAREIENTSENLRGAGLHAEMRVADIADPAPAVPKGTWIVANLPYGLRSSHRASLPRLYDAVDQHLRATPSLAGALLVTRRDPALRTRRGWTNVTDFDNRGVGVSLFRIGC